MRTQIILISAYLTLMLLSTGCGGTLTRTELAHGQQVICWEPSRKVNGLVAYVADKVEAH